MNGADRGRDDYDDLQGVAIAGMSTHEMAALRDEACQTGAGVLRVDDDPDELEFAEIALKRIPPSIVNNYALANCGELALRHVVADPTAFQVGLLDVKMPKLNGIETARGILHALSNGLVDSSDMPSEAELIGYAASSTELQCTRKGVFQLLFYSGGLTPLQLHDMGVLMNATTDVLGALDKNSVNVRTAINLLLAAVSPVKGVRDNARRAIARMTREFFENFDGRDSVPERFAVVDGKGCADIAASVDGAVDNNGDDEEGCETGCANCDAKCACLESARSGYWKEAQAVI